MIIIIAAHCVNGSLKVAPLRQCADTSGAVCGRRRLPGSNDGVWNVVRFNTMVILTNSNYSYTFERKNSSNKRSGTLFFNITLLTMIWRVFFDMMQNEQKIRQNSHCVEFSAMEEFCWSTMKWPWLKRLRRLCSRLWLTELNRTERAYLVSRSLADTWLLHKLAPTRQHTKQPCLYHSIFLRWYWKCMK